MLNFPPKGSMGREKLLRMMGFSWFVYRWRCLKMNYEMHSVSILVWCLKYVCWTKPRKRNDVSLQKHFCSLIYCSPLPLLYLMDLLSRVVKLWLHMELGAGETMTLEIMKQIRVRELIEIHGPLFVSLWRRACKTIFGDRIVGKDRRVRWHQRPPESIQGDDVFGVSGSANLILGMVRRDSCAVVNV